MPAGGFWDGGVRLSWPRMTLCDPGIPGSGRRGDPQIPFFTCLPPWSGLEGAGDGGVIVSPSKGMATRRDGSRSGYGLGDPRRASGISKWKGSGTSESILVPDFESDPESDQTTRHPHPGLSRNPSRIKRAIRLHPSVTILDSPGGTGIQGVGREEVRSTRPEVPGPGVPPPPKLHPPRNPSPQGPQQRRPQNAHLGTAPGTRDDLGVHLTPSSATDPKHHCRE